MKKFIIVLAFLTLAINECDSAIYNSHDVSFQIPQNWSTAKDKVVANDIQVVLSNGESAIRIDIIEKANIKEIVNKFFAYKVSKENTENVKRDAENNLDWISAYKKYPWHVSGAVREYYSDNIIEMNHRLNEAGSGLSIEPDNVKYSGMATNNGNIKNGEYEEWVFAWTKPEYKDRIIGVHGLFQNEENRINVTWNGVGNRTIPEPLWTVLSTFNSSMEMSLIDMV